MLSKAWPGEEKEEGRGESSSICKGPEAGKRCLGVSSPVNKGKRARLGTLKIPTPYVIRRRKISVEQPFYRFFPIFMQFRL